MVGCDPLQIAGLARPRKHLKKSERVGTAGSCFGQRIARQLRQRGFTFVDVEPPPSFLDPAKHMKFGFGAYSARYGNIYTAAQLRQLVERAHGLRTPEEAVWTRDGRFFDPFRTQIEPNGFASEEEVRADQASHLSCVQRLFALMDVFVFTLGLTEAWRSKHDGSVYPLAPGVGDIGRFDPSRYEFVNFGFLDAWRDLSWTIRFLKKRNPRLRFILTVSPVPIAATASGQHVLAASVYTKSVLRAVAGELAAKYDDVDYFPGYEIISASPYRSMFFEPSLREVSAAGVEHVMEIFVREFCDSDAQEPAAPVDPTDVMCEEEVLAFYAEQGR